MNRKDWIKCSKNNMPNNMVLGFNSELGRYFTGLMLYDNFHKEFHVHGFQNSGLVDQYQVIERPYELSPKGLHWLGKRKLEDVITENDIVYYDGSFSASQRGYYISSAVKYRKVRLHDIDSGDFVLEIKCEFLNICK